MTARAPTTVTLHDTRFVECRYWNDSWTPSPTMVKLPDTIGLSSADGGMTIGLSSLDGRRPP